MQSNFVEWAYFLQWSNYLVYIFNISNSFFRPILYSKAGEIDLVMVPDEDLGSDTLRVCLEFITSQTDCGRRVVKMWGQT